MPHREILTYEEIVRIVRLLAEQGLARVRLTGGEPLVRRGIVDFVRRLSTVPGIKDIAMTTNGSLLAGMAAELKDAGLTRVNISLDTVDPERFRFITGGGDIDSTLRGIDAALTAGFSPVKLNVVTTSCLNDNDLAYFFDIVKHLAVAVRFIEYMPINSPLPAKPGMSIARIQEKLELMGGPLQSVAFGGGAGPARYFTLPGAQGVFGFITPISSHFCGSCNRIRLTSDGKLRLCLLSNNEVDIKTALREGASDEALTALMMEAVSLKPKGHNLTAFGQNGLKRKMSQIGG